MTSPPDDRRQRAREAGHDAVGYPLRVSGPAHRAVEAAIETATRVQITPEIETEFFRAYHDGYTRDGLAAAFRAAGFEIVE